MMFLRRGMTKQIRIEFLKTTWDLKYRVLQQIKFVLIRNIENKDIPVCVSIVQIEQKYDSHASNNNLYLMESTQCNLIHKKE